MTPALILTSLAECTACDAAWRVDVRPCRGEWRLLDPDDDLCPGCQGELRIVRVGDAAPAPARREGVAMLLGLAACAGLAWWVAR